MDTNNPNPPRQEERRDDRSFTDKSYERYKTARKARKMYTWLRRARIAARAARLGTLFAGGGWTLLIAFAVVLFILFVGAIYLLLFKDDSAFNNFTRVPIDDETQPSPPGTTPIPGLSITLSEVDPVSAGSQVTIPINVTYSGVEDVEVTASIPQGAQFVSATGDYRLLGDLVSWRLSTNEPTSETGEDGGTAMPPNMVSLYNSYGFPNPTEPAEMSSVLLNRWNTHVKPHAERASASTGVPVEVLGMWPFFEGIAFNPYTDNCNDPGFRTGPGIDNDINTPCMYDNWQTGHGVRPMETTGYLADAVTVMHQGRNIQDIGQEVIDESRTRSNTSITYFPSGFPNASLNEIISGAETGDPDMRMALGILMMDDGIGMYVLGRVFEGLVGPGMASTMQSWAPSYYDPQRIINYIAGVYEVGGSTTRTYEFSLTIEAEGNNLEVRGYEISGRYVNSGAVNF